MGTKRPIQHVVDAQANDFFRAAMNAADWVPRRQDPDYAIDYIVEKFQSIGGGPQIATGIQLAVQLKGTAKPRIRDGTLRFSCSVNDLIYYVDCMRSPVFLVVVDTRRGIGYWSFLQAYVLDKLTGTWRARPSVTVRIPTANRLADIAAFEAAVHAADTRMAEIRPGALDGVLRVGKARIESVLPSVRVSVQPPKYMIHAEDDIEFSLFLSGKPDCVKRAMNDMLDKGLSVSAADYEVSIETKGPLEAISGTSMISRVEATQSHDGTAVISAIDPGGVERGNFEIPGRWEGGRKEIRFSATLGTPAIIGLNLVVPDVGTNSKVNIGWQFNWDAWEGTRLAALEHFDKLVKVFGRLKADWSLRLEFLLRGNQLMSSTTTLRQQRSLTDIAAAFPSLEKARFVAHHLNHNLRFSAHPKNPMFANVEFCYRLLQGETVFAGRNTLTLTVQASDESLERIRSSRAEGRSAARHVVPSFNVSLLDQEVQIGPLEFTCEQSTMKETGSGQDSGDSSLRLVEWKVRPLDEWKVRLLPQATETSPLTLGES